MKEKKIFLRFFCCFVGIFAIIHLIVYNDTYASEVMLNTTEVTLSIGESYKLTLLNANGKVKWHSTNTKVVTTDGAGCIKAISYGKTNVWAQYEGRKYYCSVNVHKIVLNKTSLKLKEGESFKLRLKGSKAVSFISSNKKIAKVSSKGKIRGIKSGRAKITVEDSYGRKYKCKVIVVDNNPSDVLDDSKELYGTDINAIKNRIVDEIWESGYRYYKVDLSEKPEKDNQGMFLKSIDYSLERPSKWPAIYHLEYIMAYIKKVGSDCIQKNEDDREVVLKLIDYWLENDFYNSTNWYSNQIAVPYDLGDIAVLVKDYLNENQINRITAILNRGTVGAAIKSDDISASSNSCDYINISIRKALLTDDEELLLLCVRQIEKLIEYGSEQRTGIQKDLSYFDYSCLVSGGSYAGNYTKNIAYYLALFHGTKFQFNEEKEQFFIDFILDGQRFFNRCYGTPAFSLGRLGVVATGGEYYRTALEYLLVHTDLYRYNELKKYYDSFEDTSFISNDIKCFPCSGTLVLNNAQSYIAIRGCQDGYSLTNVQNSEGVLNYNLSYGSNTCYMINGKEYSSIAAVFDFSMFPGTTSFAESDLEIKERWEKGYNKTWGHVDFVKVKDSKCCLSCNNVEKNGILVTELHNGIIEGKNCFIIVNGSLYALGVGFHVDEKINKNIVTTVNQCLSDDNYMDNKTINCGEYYINGGFRYTNLCDSELHIEKKIRTGSISRTNLNTISEAESRNVFLCYYNWGSISTDMNINYAYSVSPENSEMQEIREIINTDDCQLIVFKNGEMMGYAYGDVIINDQIIKKGFVVSE